MKNIYTWAAKPARRNLTVADLRAGNPGPVLTAANQDVSGHAC